MNKELVFLKGFAKGKQYWKLMKAIDIALKLHDGQIRNNGEPYIIHPTRVASELLNLGIQLEDTLCVAVLHDVIEDCGVSSADLCYDYGMGLEVAEAVSLLSKTKDTKLDMYYSNITGDEIATLVKISDRCHNISTMIGTFSKERIEKYVYETERYVLLLCKNAINLYPQHSDVIFVMRYHIETVVNCAKEFLKLMEGDSYVNE